jgi:hypothetical protein
VKNNPASLTDPSGYIDEGQEAKDADQKVEGLENIYQVRVFKAWGFVTRPTNYSGPATSTSCVWQKGEWTFHELEILEAGVTNLANAMGSAGKFISNIGGVTVSQNSIWARGLTTRHRIRFTNSSHSIDEWTVIHELGHAWDANFGWRLSEGLENATGGYTVPPVSPDLVPIFTTCDPDRRLPGCNDAGYFYNGVPPAGSDAHFDRKEDFAESVVGYVHPSLVQQRAASFSMPALSYPDFTQTPRYTYIEGLIKGTITVP